MSQGVRGLLPGDLYRLTRVRRMAKSGEARAIREAAHISRPELAAVLGVDKTDVWRWERGQHSPLPLLALKWDKALQRMKRSRSA